MYSDEELDAAAAAGILTEEHVIGFRRFIGERRGQVGSAEHERFRLLTGFNDVFVSVCSGLILLAASYLGGQAHGIVSGLAVAAVSWGLAEYFTRKLRLSLTSIVLLIGFAAGTLEVGITAIAAMLGLTSVADVKQVPAVVSVAAVLGTAGIYLHWRRFMVPITVAAGSAIALLAAFALLLALIPALGGNVRLLVLLGGLAMFAVAMYWDRQDRERMTRRSDVAFWAHLLASPLIIHPIFAWVGVTSAQPVMDSGVALAACIGTYLAIALVSLAIDRRAMLISALVYVLFAMSQLFAVAGSAREINMALAALVIGSGLLLLSTRWEAARRLLVHRLPTGLSGMLPVAR